MHNKISLAQIRVKITILDYPDLEEKFLDLNLLQGIKNTSINIPKSKVFHGYRHFWLTFSFHQDYYEEIFDAIIEELISRTDELEAIGWVPEDEEYFGISMDFYFEHNGSMTWYLKKNQLLKMNELLKPSFCIDSCFDSSTEISESRVNEEWGGGIHIYQIIFRLNNSSEEVIATIKEMFDHNLVNYASYSRWTESKNPALLLFEINPDLIGRKGYRVHRRMLAAIRKNRSYLTRNNIDILFGFYCSDRLCTELGEAFLAKIIYTGVDMIFSLDYTENIDGNIPDNTLELIKENLLLKK